MSVRLDHIVILLPYSSLLALPAWIPKNLTVSPGGVHSHGQTENRLICFADGSYLELISFVDDLPANRVGHGWGDRQYGIVDFAFTGAEAESNYARISAGLLGLEEEAPAPPGRQIVYDKPFAGGRTRPDGEVLKWKVTCARKRTASDQGVQRGEVPFFCHDVTARELRMPLSEESVGHPCATYGLKEMSIVVPRDQVARLAKAYEVISGVPNTAGEVEGGLVEGIFEIPRVNDIEGAGGVKIRVKEASDEWQVKAMEQRDGVVLCDIVFGAHGSQSEGGGTRVRIDAGDIDVGRMFLDVDIPHK